ncbi:hypothetical protein ACQKQC_17940 [Vibrio fortis]|uniref:hypothetical protein n=1 Tax=Vibrio fortis TaxID=212667 RepID=UPI004067C179
MSNIFNSKVLVIQTSSGKRFFTRFGKNGSVQTAWSLAGATHFLHTTDLLDITQKLDRKQKQFEIHEVNCQLVPSPSLLRGGL